MNLLWAVMTDVFTLLGRGFLLKPPLKIRSLEAHPRQHVQPMRGSIQEGAEDVSTGSDGGVSTGRSSLR